jgi:adenosylcobinamide-phosphate synthase
VLFLPWQLVCAYGLDLILGDPRVLPHPIRWIGRYIAWVESIFYTGGGSAALQRAAGAVFWLMVLLGVGSATFMLLSATHHLHSALGWAVAIWLAYTSLATRSLHLEARGVVAALAAGDLPQARRRLGGIVSRETAGLGEEDIYRGLVETVAENVCDGVVAPLFFLALGGPLAAMLFKAVNTMDSMVGYKNARYRHFGWAAARADDLANWVPARLTGLFLVAAAAALKLDWRAGWHVMGRDGRKLTSPNAGIPQAAAAGALGIRLGGENVYFGNVVRKPHLGEARRPIDRDAYAHMIRLLYAASLLSFLLALALRFWLVRG